MKRADDDAGQRGDDGDVEHGFAGFFERGDDFLERRAGFFLQRADDEDDDDGDHAGFAGFPILDHERVDENRQRNQKHPARADDFAKFGNLISGKSR